MLKDACFAFSVLCLMGGVTAGLMMALTFLNNLPAPKSIQTLRSMPTTSAAELQLGKVGKVVGKVRAIETILSGLTSTKCVFWQAEMEISGRYNWMQASHMGLATPYYIDDDSGRLLYIAVENQSVYLKKEVPSQYGDTPEQTKEALLSAASIPRKYRRQKPRYREGTLVEGEVVAAFGTLETREINGKTEFVLVGKPLYVSDYVSLGNLNNPKKAG